MSSFLECLCCCFISPTPDPQIKSKSKTKKPKQNRLITKYRRDDFVVVDE